MRALLTLRSVFILCLAAGADDPAASQVPASADFKPVSDRVVHCFDFDERAAGNLEDVPKYWTPFRPSGFPRFATGRFDFEVGRLTPPSFYLACNGRSVAYHYTGPETRVRANSEYRIEGFMRPDRLQSARACLSAHFLDKFGNPIGGTLSRTHYVGKTAKSDEWSRVELYLPAAPPEAHTIGLIAWVLQEPMWNTSVPPRRHIPRVDVHAGAWFDDITTQALPRVAISTTTPGNLLTGDGPQELQIILADTEDTGLMGRLFITAADEGLVETHTIPVVIDEIVEPTVIPVDHLTPGFYQARLEVFAGDTVITSRRLSFVRLAPLRRKSGANARPFGVVVQPQSRSDVDREAALLRNQVARSVKLPVWTGLPEDPPTPAQHRATDRLLQTLLTDGFALTGVFFGPPGVIVRSDGPYPRSLIALLNEPPAVWQEHLASVVARYASVFQWWQVGSDADATPVKRDELTGAITQLRETMRRFVTVPLLTLPASSSVEPDQEKWPVEQLSLTIGAEILPDGFAPEVHRFEKLGYGNVSAYVAPLPAGRYLRIPRLTDWAQRIIEARFAGADTVFVPQTWHVRETAHGKVTEPTEEFIVYRTIADVISGALPGQRVRIAPGVRCMAFHDARSTVLAMWDPLAPQQGSRHAIQLGEAADRQIDLWGRIEPLEQDEHGRQVVRLTPMPVLIDGVERWLIDLRSSISLQPNHVESGTELAHHTIELAHHGTKPISGNMYLEAPEAWDVTPRRFTFNLMPQRTVRLPVEVHYPHNEVAGAKDIRAKISLMGGSYYLEVPLSVEVALLGVEVSGMAVIEGSDLVVQHVVANRSDGVLHFRGAAQVPGRQRQYRPLSNLQPGDTQTVEYRFSDARTLAGSKVRVGLREMNDGPRTHTIELTIP